MKLENVHTIENIQRFTEGILNDYDLGVSDYNQTLTDLKHLIFRILEKRFYGVNFESNGKKQRFDVLGSDKKEAVKLTKKYKGNWIKIKNIELL